MTDLKKMSKKQLKHFGPSQNRPNLKFRKTPTARQATAVEFFYATGNATQSGIAAGFSPKSSRSYMCELLKKPHIKEYLAELRDSDRSSAIAGMTEKRERLTELLREDNISKDGLKQRYGNLQAAEILNKMDGVYSDGTTIINDNKSIRIIVESKEGERLFGMLTGGKLPSGTEDNDSR